MSDETCRQCGRAAETQDGLCPECAVLEALPDEVAGRKELAGIPFMDMKSQDEVDRIKTIAAMIKERRGQVIAVMVDTAEGYEGKGDRYIAGVKKLVPQMQIVKRLPGPIKDTETISFVLR